MITSGQFIGFIPITDTARARAFYADTLGLTVVEETPFALVLDANGTMLRLTPVGDYRPHPFTIAGWGVDDIAATIAALTAHGVVFHHYEGMEQDDAGVWSSPSGALIAWFADPDGNTLSLTQFP